MLDVNEIFYTIQGEGPMTGKPSIFIRLTGCNLRCYWCDTPYTWLYSEAMATKIRERLPTDLKDVALEIHDRKKETHPMSVDQIMEKISKFEGTHIVVTGGEPLLQKDKLQYLLTTLLDRSYSIEIETNGTISPDDVDERVIFNVSPKLENSYNPKSRRYKSEVLREFVSRSARFKFVIADPNDLEEVEAILEENSVPHQRVYLMPEGRTSEELLDKSKWLVNICKANNFNYTHRLHIDIFDEDRGV